MLLISSLVDFYSLGKMQMGSCYKHKFLTLLFCPSNLAWLVLQHQVGIYSWDSLPLFSPIYSFFFLVVAFLLLFSLLSFAHFSGIFRTLTPVTCLLLELSLFSSVVSTYNQYLSTQYFFNWFNPLGDSLFGRWLTDILCKRRRLFQYFFGTSTCACTGYTEIHYIACLNVPF